MKKHFLFTVAGLVLTAVSTQAQQIQEPNLIGLESGSILMCKDNQCVQTSSEMVRDYLYNQVNDLMNANIGQEVTLCEADPTQHKCIQKGIAFPVQSKTIQTTIKIGQAQIVDAKPVKDTANGVDIILDYHVRAGETFPRCQTSLTRIGIASATDVKMMSPQFNCRLTETGKTTFSIVYNIEYLDMDTGTIGAFYTVDANNALNGSNGGYILMQLKKGLEIEAGEIFPYPAQLKAIKNGTMPPINDPEMLEKMGAFWLKPTPFLNLTTPLFAPNNCFEFEGGCSAEMLNEPKKAIPPAAEKIAKLIPEGVPATVGLIQQTVTYENPQEPVMKQTVTTNRQVLENDKTVFEEKETKNYIQQTPDSELIEETEKTVKETTGNQDDIIPAIMMKNAEKEYQSLKQFEAQETVAGQVTTVDGKEIKIPARTIEQTQETIEKPTNTTTSNIQIITPEGVTLSDEERAYIEKISLSEEDIIKRIEAKDAVLQNITQNQLIQTNTIQNEVAPTLPQKTPQEQIDVTAKTPEKSETNPINEIALPVVQVSQRGLTPTQDVVVTNKTTLPEATKLPQNIIPTPQKNDSDTKKQPAQIQEVKTVTTTTTTETPQPEQPIYNVKTANLEISDDVKEFPLIEDYPVIQSENNTVKKDGESVWQKMRKGISNIFYF